MRRDTDRATSIAQRHAVALRSRHMPAARHYVTHLCVRLSLSACAAYDPLLQTRSGRRPAIQGTPDYERCARLSRYDLESVNVAAEWRVANAGSRS